MNDLSHLSPMHQQVHTLPGLVRDIAEPFAESARATFDAALATSVQQIVLTGCGDSFHAPTGAELAFNQLAGVPTRALSAMTYSHYNVGFMPKTGPHTNLTIAVSVSGVVSRTIEALKLARQAGAIGVALTGKPNAALAQNADRVFQTTVPPLPDEMQGMIVPGVRSYAASQVALYNAAIRLGELRDNLTAELADALRAELLSLADVIEATIEACAPVAKQLAADWADLKEYIFVGTGPSYGVAMFSAAKVLEASGDPAMAQETEEWAHIQYFSAQPNTPTVFISAADFDAVRMAECVAAAKLLGRRTAVVVPQSARAEDIIKDADVVLPVKGEVREAFWPLVASIPGELIAAERAEAIGAKYFQDFKGGRESDGVSRPSRIYDSAMLDEVRS